MRDISKRIEVATGLSLHSAEDFQVAHYKAGGGHYAPHFDWGLETQISVDFGDYELKGERELRGARLATFLIYLNDVPSGGATSFVRANVSVRPAAGSALFWYNLKPSGEGDERTVHGACELTAGEKCLRPLHLKRSLLRGM